MDNLILVDIVQSQFRAHSHDDVKLKGLSGSCIFAYEFYPIIGSSDLDPAKRPEAQQTLSDIQRGALSCEFLSQKSILVSVDRPVVPGCASRRVCHGTTRFWQIS